MREYKQGINLEGEKGEKLAFMERGSERNIGRHELKENEIMCVCVIERERERELVLEEFRKRKRSLERERGRDGKRKR